MLRPLQHGLICNHPYCTVKILCSITRSKPRPSSQQQAVPKPSLHHQIRQSDDAGLPCKLSPKPQHPSAPQQPSKTQSRELLKHSTVALSQPHRSSTASQVDATKSRHTKPKHQRDPALQSSDAHNAKDPKPKQINHWLVDASSPDQILGIFAQHHERFNTINISTAFHRVAKVHSFLAVMTYHCIVIC